MTHTEMSCVSHHIWIHTPFAMELTQGKTIIAGTVHLKEFLQYTNLEFRILELIVFRGEKHAHTSHHT